MVNLCVPGRPIHVRITGDSLMVSFEHVPWRFQMVNVAKGLEAFSNNDWQFFQKSWWEKHRFLQFASPELERLLPLLGEEVLYSVSEVLALGRFHGLYDRDDSKHFQQDRQRLVLAPLFFEWAGNYDLPDESADLSWPGTFWRQVVASLPGTFQKQMPSLPVVSDQEWMGIGGVA